ncbi:Zn-dependent hydrolase [uncultured Cohaesibacter sp.]|uniref:Zn-dependent hydrolase n=1 Tax=uncultured Cohaesibacter sp. TaxID=1002546 RepID=UPI00293024EF|nr:Zn-dependent hydrolase [uncultured Cohaesibacter sp.]
MTSIAPTIKSERLKNLLAGINQFGLNPVTGGFNRIGFSQSDFDAREWLSAQMKGDGLSVTSDDAGNLFGRYGRSDRPCIMAGSHTDTVPEGGAFDGALGVSVALECARCLIEHDIEPDFPLVVVSTSEEEGRFGGMLGSQTISGQLAPGWVRSAVDAEGFSLLNGMAHHGLDPDALPDAAWPEGSIRAFLELHIEQGPVLETEQLSVGIVEAISGVCNLAVTLTGVANHSGTTPMTMRADAFAGLSMVGSAIPDVIDRVGTDHSRVTIGKVEIRPNFPHTVPGVAEFMVNIRDNSAAVMADLRREIETAIKLASKSHGLSYRIKDQSYLPPDSLDPALRALLQEEASRLGLSHKVMPSGAGHDAQTIQAFCPSGLIFVPSHKGISHSPEEWTDWEHIEKGAQLMLNAILRLTQEGL